MPRTIADHDSMPDQRTSRGGPSRELGRSKLWFCGLVALAVCFVASLASAEVSFEGEWPETESPVSLSVAGEPRAAAIRQLAEQAGWSLVLESTAQEPVDLMVRDQPPAKVLEALLREGSWIAHREGTLVSIARQPQRTAAPSAAAPAASVPPAPSAAAPLAGTPAASTSSPPQDRFAAGSTVTVAAGETVRDLVVMGGAAEVLGTVNGDLVVFGGTATVRSGGHVKGDSVVFGGSLDIDSGGVVDGDQVAFGGAVRKDGEVVSGTPFDSNWRHPKPWSGPSILGRVAHGVAHAALLFLFGAFLLAVAGRRMESLEVAFAARPLRSLLHGLLAGLLLILATVILAVTCIGIPIAAALLLASLIAASAGLCAVLTTVGAALVRHRNENPYVHLAVGCAVYLVVGLVPIIGSLGTFLLGAMGLGVVVSTRAAGLWSGSAVSDSTS